MYFDRFLTDFALCRRHFSCSTYLVLPFLPGIFWLNIGVWMVCASHSVTTGSEDRANLCVEMDSFNLRALKNNLYTTV